ncbi:MAG: hypothetical protein AAF585_05690 [Verrucomicrobiota bacterium]
MRRLFQSSAVWAIGSAGIRAGGALITLPLALRLIPEAEMGLYYTFLGLIALANLLDMGFGQTLSRFASYAWAGAERFQSKGLPSQTESTEPNLTLLQQLMTNARSWYSIVGAIAALILMAPGVVFIRAEINEVGLSDHLVFCWLVMALGVSFSFASEFWRTILFGIGRVREAHQVSVIAQVCGVVATALGLVVGLGIWAFPISRFVVAGLNRFIALGLLRKHTTACPKGWIDFSQVSVMWPMAWRQGVIAIGEFLVLRGNVLICTALFGLEVTARYGLSLQIFGVLGAICAAPAAVIAPKISRLRIQGDSESIVRLFGIRLYPGLLAMIVFGAFVILFGRQLLELIGSKTGLISNELLAALLVIQILQMHQNFYASLVLTENENPFVIPTLITGALVAICSFSLGSIWALPGLVISQGLVPLLFLNWWVVLRGYHGLNLPFRRFIGCFVSRA